MSQYCLNDLNVELFLSAQVLLILQHLVRLRWDELNPDERRNFASVAVDLMSEITNSTEEWALKSQTSALVAEVVLLFLPLFFFLKSFGQFI